MTTKYLPRHDENKSQKGFTLIELLIALTILGIVMIGLQQVIGTSLSALRVMENKRDLMAQARYAIDRMTLFVTETDNIFKPDGPDQEVLKVSERVLDIYDNATHAFLNDGDGYLDSDNDSDGAVNEGGLDTADLITFDLDKTDGGNWKLREQMPDYSTATLDDFRPQKVLCEHVSAFISNVTHPDLIEIQLSLKNGKQSVSLKTRVQAKNISSGGGGADDTMPPSPDPMTWSAPPTANGASSITMTAATASDESGLEYYFYCTAGGGHCSGWQDSPAYEDAGLVPSTLYTYRVKVRDKSPNKNQTEWSTEVSATTQAPGVNDIYVNSITMGWRRAGQTYYGRATVEIWNGLGGAVEGATVSGVWSGDVSGSGSGITAADGTVMIESSGKSGGGTYTFTVTDVAKAGCTYVSSLNVETTDSITAP